MADIELVIRIPEETYEYWKEHKHEYILAEAIANGTPLPKGHGRLIEADNLKRYIIETYHDPIIVCNDDEVHFVAEIIDDYPTVEAIPKDQYEARLTELRSMALRVKHNTGSIDTLIDKLDDLLSEVKE